MKRSLGFLGLAEKSGNLGIGEEALKSHYERDEIRQYIIDHYRSDLIAKQYMELYGKCIRQLPPN